MKRLPELNALPDTVYRQTVERLTAGQRVATVARWLMTQHRGALQHEPLYDIRKHVAELQFHIGEHEQDSSDTATKLEPPTAIADCDRMSARAVLQSAFIDAVDHLEFERSQQQKAGQSGEMRFKVRKEICRIGEALGKLEHAELRSRGHGNGDFGVQPGKAAGNAESENLEHINSQELTPSQLELQTRARGDAPDLAHVR